MYNRSITRYYQLRKQALERFWDFRFSLIPDNINGGKVFSDTKMTPIYEMKAAHMTYKYYRAIARKLNEGADLCTTRNEKYKLSWKIKRATYCANYIKEYYSEYFEE